MKFKKLQSIFVMAILLILVLTGCANSPAISSDADQTNTYSNGPGSSTVYPITIQHVFGETVIETEPKRVAAISWGNQDVPLALGVVPVGVSEANYGVTDGSGLLPWTLAKFKELGIDNPILFRDTDGLDYEAISDVQPDVILAAYSGITQEEYDLLSKIAPVVAYTTHPWQTFWRDQIVLNAAGLGMKSEGQELISELENLIAEKISEYPENIGKTAAFFYFNPSDLGKFYIYLPNDPRAAYLTDLGMMLPESIAKLAKESDSFALELSAENVDLIEDIDIIITYGSDALIEALQANPLLGMIPAVKRGSIAVIEDGTPLAASGTPSALSIPATIDEYLSIIGEAAEKVE
ncbi:ABC-type Fe3+-hydroxamate transport system, periplasmic component [Clostridium aceticum]|uniref:ABC-type Fe3+-hydroxamate transport system, periplasmic component n=1 Tax=Clostridium aceticum TaxID=84022 RepID=A0A0D8I9R8_9CLOT|nr:iron-siderophore ABC transporter substrate-binding protein [Clostridium aceticum]AKL96029.1 ABC-type Fe3+-hydroxamate transport system, periplasmic component [Clostridium aceticum]KJF27035.1 iron ABC transporter permease [Clostridium aceticum]